METNVIVCKLIIVFFLNMNRYKQTVSLIVMIKKIVLKLFKKDDKHTLCTYYFEITLICKQHIYICMCDVLLINLKIIINTNMTVLHVLTISLIHTIYCIYLSIAVINISGTI